MAGGKSVRFGDDKLLVEIKDKPLIYYSLRTFDRVKRISELILVVREDKINFYQEKIKEWNLSKVAKRHNINRMTLYKWKEVVEKT